MEVTKIRAKVFGQYLGSEVSLLGGTIGNLIEVREFTLKVRYYDADGMSIPVYPPHEDCQLILTPLDKITDEDMREVAKIECSAVWDDRFKVGVSDDRLYVRYWDGDLYGVYLLDELSSQSIDLLRSKGYATKYLGIDLYTAGIAIKP